MKNLKTNRFHNPHQRFGFVVVNVIIGKAEGRDAELFFGPLHQNDVTVCWLDHNASLPALLRDLGIFETANDAVRGGYRGPIPSGFTDLLRIGKERNRVTILKVPESEDEHVEPDV
jgi:hypothetical protein